MDGLNKELKEKLIESFKGINNFFLYLEIQNKWHETAQFIEYVDWASINSDKSARFAFLSKTYDCCIQNLPIDTYLYFKYILRNFLYVWQEDQKEAKLILEKLKKNMNCDSEKVLASIALYLSIFQSQADAEQFVFDRSHLFAPDIMLIKDYVVNQDYCGLRRAMVELWYMPAIKVMCDKMVILNQIEYNDHQKHGEELESSLRELNEEALVIAKTPLKRKRSPVKMISADEFSTLTLSARSRQSQMRSISKSDFEDESDIDSGDSMSPANPNDSFRSTKNDLRRQRLQRSISPVTQQILWEQDRYGDRRSPNPYEDSELTLRLDESVEEEPPRNDLLNMRMREEEILAALEELGVVEVSYDGGREMQNFLNCSRMDERDLCFGQYECVRVLGEGGCSKVYEAICKNDGHRYAVKVMYYSEPSSKKMVEDEIRIMKTMSATNRSIKIIDSRISDNGAVIVMEKAMADLKEFLTLDGSISHRPITVLYYWEQMLLCVKAMHDKRISHLDLKLQNFVLTETFEVKLIDFGISRELCPDTSIIHDKDGCGTVVFMSPELLRGEKIVSPKKCDVWAMGVVLYVLLFNGIPRFVTQPRVVHEAHDTEEFKYFVLHPKFEIYFPTMSTWGPIFRELIAMTLTHDVKNRATIDELIDLINEDL